MGTRRLNIVVMSVLAGLLPNTGLAAPPDLCADVVLGPNGQPYTDSVGQTISKWCEPRVDPPAWAGEVCCVVTDEANCVAPDEVGRCSVGMKFTCAYGEQVGDGVACYQPGPSACEIGACGDDAPAEPVVPIYLSWLCCEGDIDFMECRWAGDTSDLDIPEVACGGFFAVCNWGWTNLDGTVTCIE